MTDAGAEPLLPDWDQPGANTRLERVLVDGRMLKPGDQVRLRPKHSADAFDILLAGRMATIESIEQDYEDRVYIAVTVDEDPGRELGLMRQPGHRFFYASDEVEPLGGAALGARRRASWWPASAIFFWATTALAWR
jgi:hypothetical protein